MLSGLAAHAQPAHQHQARPRGQIAFASDRSANAEIYVMAANGTMVRRLTRHPSDDEDPSWSPNGRRLAFVSNRDGDPDIYVMSADGSRVQRLTTNDSDDTEPDWSPNGRDIAFVTNRDGNDELYVMRSDGSRPRRLTRHTSVDLFTPPDVASPTWSPNGRSLAFASNRDGDSEIYVMNADGAQVRKLTNHPADDGDPAWSPDARRIVYTSDRGHPAIYLINVDGTAGHRLTNNPNVYFHSPTWSPDGTRIAYVSSETGNIEIHTMNTQGGQTKRLTRDKASDFAPDWLATPP